ncbi:uncharacterized protein LOC111259386 isoform X2 [Varroa jacobsoni]|uniref:uncharacterized protein LOC111259386 isoform X2 n=1 Tax=Varroa jacobsoni TaxID=62625 RepID=UPI000BF69748|nr:uncharacterized protein LOC111259386 isoform X2 [Varroa jacobsoni]
MQCRHLVHHSRLPMSGEGNLDLNRYNLNHFNHLERERPSINRTLTPTNVTGQLGATVYLHCVVHNLGQKTVTWHRHSDYHVLTVGLMTYTTDERFSAVRSELPTVLASGTLSPTEPPSAIGPIEDWMLQIRGVAESDAGEYECNVNTQHPIISLNVTLSVLAPHASIVESPELYVNRGSTIKLTCIIHDCPQPLTHIFWYHQDKVINYERHANITIERATPSSNEVSGWSASAGSWNSSGVPQRGSVSTQVSRLLIPAASAEHSGRYTCAPIHSNAVVVHVHVLHAEEHLARKSHEASSAGSTGSPADRPWSLSIHASLSLLALELFFLLVVASTT